MFERFFTLEWFKNGVIMKLRKINENPYSSMRRKMRKKLEC